MRAPCCGEFTAKDFRTWGGPVFAFSLLRKKTPPTSEREGKRLVTEVVKEVAEHLGNTPAMSRKYYIHPAVIAAYMDGSLATTAKHQGAPAELSAPEADLIAVLDGATCLIRQRASAAAAI